MIWNLINYLVIYANIMVLMIQDNKNILNFNYNLQKSLFNLNSILKLKKLLIVSKKIYKKKFKFQHLYIYFQLVK